MYYVYAQSEFNGGSLDHFIDLFQSLTDPKISEVLDFSDNTQEGSNISDLRTDPVCVS